MRSHVVIKIVHVFLLPCKLRYSDSEETKYMSVTFLYLFTTRIQYNQPLFTPYMPTYSETELSLFRFCIDILLDGASVYVLGDDSRRLAYIKK